MLLDKRTHHQYVWIDIDSNYTFYFGLPGNTNMCVYIYIYIYSQLFLLFSSISLNSNVARCGVTIENHTKHITWVKPNSKTFPRRMFSMLERTQVDYVNMNPVRCGHVDLPEQWRYSSAHTYAGEPGLLQFVWICNKLYLNAERFTLRLRRGVS